MSAGISVEDAVTRFLAHKRALGRKYCSEERELRLLSRFAAERDAGLGDLTPALLQEFLGTRPRQRPRSFNHLLGVTGGLFRWAVAQELLESAPVLPRPRKAASGRVPFLFTAVQARDLLAAASALPDNERARGRGHVYEAVFALCYGLGLRAAEACGLSLGSIDACRSLLTVRGGKFGKDRLVPHGPRIGALITEQAQRRRDSDPTAGPGSPLFTFDGRRSIHPGTASQVFHRLVPALGLPRPRRRLAPDIAPSPALFCGWLPSALVSRGQRPAVEAAPAVHVHGARRPRVLGRLPDHHRRPDGRGEPPVRGIRRPGLAGGRAMSKDKALGPVIHSFFADHLITVKGLRPASVRSNRDTIRLLLTFTAADKGCKITRLTLGDLTYDRVVKFLRHLEHDRGNHVRTRNQRLAVLHTLFEYIAVRSPEMLAACQQVTAIPMKRSAPAETRFLERDEVEDLLKKMPRDGRHALRDRALILFLYNTGCRAQEAADLRAGNLDLGEQPLTRLHGKGDKWRTCPLWRQTADLRVQQLPVSALETPHDEHCPR